MKRIPPFWGGIVLSFLFYLAAFYAGYHLSYRQNMKENVARIMKRWTAPPSPQELHDFHSAHPPEGLKTELQLRNRWRTDPEFRRRRIRPLEAEARVVAMITATFECFALWGRLSVGTHLVARMRAMRIGKTG